MPSNDPAGDKPRAHEEHVRAVRAFGDAMIAKLDANAHKVHWRDCTTAYLYERLAQEVGELGAGLIGHLAHAVVRDEAADVANFAMMLFEQHREATTAPPAVASEREVLPVGWRRFDGCIRSREDCPEHLEHVATGKQVWLNPRTQPPGWRVRFNDGGPTHATRAEAMAAALGYRIFTTEGDGIEEEAREWWHWCRDDGSHAYGAGFDSAELAALDALKYSAAPTAPAPASEPKLRAGWRKLPELFNDKPQYTCRKDDSDVGGGVVFWGSAGWCSLRVNEYSGDDLDDAMRRAEDAYIEREGGPPAPVAERVDNGCRPHGNNNCTACYQRDLLTTARAALEAERAAHAATAAERDEARASLEAERGDHRQTLRERDAAARDLAEALSRAGKAEQQSAAWAQVGDGAFAYPFGTVRKCIGCGCLVAGGPTRCGRCASDVIGPLATPAQPTAPAPVRDDATGPGKATEVRQMFARWRDEDVRELIAAVRAYFDGRDHFTLYSRDRAQDRVELALDALSPAPLPEPAAAESAQRPPDCARCGKLWALHRLLGDERYCGSEPWSGTYEPAAAEQRAVRVCRGCGEALDPLKYRNADGCPCNAPRGVNHGIVHQSVCTCAECDPEETGSSRAVKPVPFGDGGWPVLPGWTWIGFLRAEHESGAHIVRALDGRWCWFREPNGFVRSEPETRRDTAIQAAAYALGYTLTTDEVGHWHWSRDGAEDHLAYRHPDWCAHAALEHAAQAGSAGT